MSKTKTAFFCNHCGYESAKWLGKCPSCNQWNTFTQEIIHKDDKTAQAESWADYQSSPNGKSQSKTKQLQNIASEEAARIVTGDSELNRVLGGGIVPGSIVLVAGEPGIGKSTLFLQTGLQLNQLTVLYISGEESAQQIKMRADRLQLQPNEFYLLTETNTQTIFQEIKKLKPGIVIVDSIQTLHTQHLDAAAGSISQIKECAAEFQRFAKATQTPVFLIGHITKDGAIAGPKLLEHMVDCVLQFEGDRHFAYRVLRTIKNRFGSTAELGLYAMANTGMQPVKNPSDILMHHPTDALSGTAIGSTVEGMRPLLVEVQALVTASVYGTPQRTVTGFDARRLQMLLAVLEKRGGFLFGMKDVFLNMAGGLKIEDPSIDLAIVAALLSSFEDIPIQHKICFAGEVGLSGEIRPVHRLEQRIAEAEKMGLEKMIVSGYNKKGLSAIRTHLELVAIAKVDELYQQLF